MAKSGKGIMPKVDFENKIKDKKAIQTTTGVGGLIYQIWELLKRNAMTRKALAEYTGVEEKSITTAIAHLKQRKNLNIERYFNLDDGDFYYILRDTPQ